MLAMKSSTADFQLPPHNEPALKWLREAKDYESALALIAGGTALATGGMVHPLGWAAFALAYKPLIRLEKLARLEKLTTVLLDEFKSVGTQIFPVQKIEDKNPLDLFVRFPRRSHLFISIRSFGDREVVYNEAREILQIRKKNKRGLTTWKPCPLLELADYEKWLNKNRDLFAMSSREATKTPAAKVLVLWPPTKAAPNHNEHLYTEIEGMKILALRRKGTAFVIQEQKVTEFIRAWLNHYQ
ncbi:hypothetical protein [Nodularia sp. UHCC 0506]|uniref:hypothetical protein n=1 Tax=Nodularia sp. UHCC 0506 TaxID=3110243 RepID=UPI002B20FFC4|nr:hypothetical protein [Nodularia sp. UHCC 0506]MEA5516778.1 hypothetical protein [Nodularia sp. UHCC 0506]